MEQDKKEASSCKNSSHQARLQMIVLCFSVMKIATIDQEDHSINQWTEGLHSKVNLKKQEFKDNILLEDIKAFHKPKDLMGFIQTRNVVENE